MIWSLDYRRDKRDLEQKAAAQSRVLPMRSRRKSGTEFRQIIASPAIRASVKKPCTLESPIIFPIRMATD
jgi:hypothetical protein